MDLLNRFLKIVRYGFTYFSLPNRTEFHLSRKNFSSAVKTIERLLKKQTVFQKFTEHEKRDYLGIFYYLQFLKLSDYCKSAGELLAKPTYEFDGKRILVLAENGADLTIVSQYMSGASSIRIFAEGKCRGERAIRKLNAEIQEISELYPLYDVTRNQAASRRSSIAGEQLERVLRAFFLRTPLLQLFRGHEYALSHSVEFEFLRYFLRQHAVFDLLEEEKYDSVCVIAADGEIVPFLLPYLYTKLGDDVLMIARTRRKFSYDKQYYSRLEKSLRKVSLELHSDLKEPAKNSGQLSVAGRRKGGNWKQGYAIEANQIRVNKFILGNLVRKQRGEQSLGSEYVFFPFGQARQTISRGDFDLITRLYRGKKVAALYEDFLAEKQQKELGKLTHSLSEAGVEFEAIFLEPTKTALAVRKNYHQAALQLATRILRIFSRSFRGVPELDKMDWLFDSGIHRPMCEKMAKVFFTIGLFDEFLRDTSLKTVVCYPCALPSARILTNFARLKKVPTIDVQPFFIMDEPRTCFHWKKNGDFVCAQSAEFVPLFRKLGYAEKNIFVTGSPRIDQLYMQMKQLPERAIGKFGNATGNKVILFADQLMNILTTQEILSFLVDYCSRNSDTNLIYKPHYRQVVGIKRKMTQLCAEHKNIHVLSSEDIYELIDAADLVITLFSNVALEAAIMGKPVITINLTGVPYPAPMDLHNWGISLEARSVSELDEMVAGLLAKSDLSGDLSQRRRHFFKSHPELAFPIAISQIEKKSKASWTIKYIGTIKMAYENFERGYLGRQHYKSFTNFSKDKIHILLGCFPKSGSTYLRALIHNLPGMEQVNLVPGYDRREQELSTDELVLNHDKNYVAQHHTRYSQVTETLIDNFRLQPVILVRNLFDVVESTHDHFFNEGIVMPFNFVPEESLNWKKPKIRNFITDMIIPWYFNFYVSWLQTNNKLLVTYDDLTQNTTMVLQKIIGFTHISCSKKDIEHSIECSSKLHTRLNKGISGRGEKLPKYVKNKIISMSKYYPEIDFSPIGL